MDEGLIRRTTDIHCNKELHELQASDETHDHAKIRGKDSKGLRTSQSAVHTLCEKIIGAVERLRSKPNGGGEL